jgi:hypothetical protein
MNYAQLLYALRAACRGWVALASEQVPPDVVHALARDLLTLTDHDIDPFHDARVILLSQRPLSPLDHCIYSTVEIARAEMLRRHEVVDAVAHNAILLALATDHLDDYVVDLLGLFPRDVLQEARVHLHTRVMMRDMPDVFRLAVHMIDERISSVHDLLPAHGASSKHVSSPYDLLPNDLPPLTIGDHDVTEETDAGST